MKKEQVQYQAGKTILQGYVVYDDTKNEKRPGIIIAHAWMGQDAFARGKAEALAKLGYVGFAADVYGGAKEAVGSEEAEQLMLPLFQDRKELLLRITAGYEALKNHPLVDPTRIGGIGFCFGGLTIIELFRSGAPLKAVVSFHAVLGSKMRGITAKTLPMASGITGSILIAHGHDDPLVSEDDIKAIQGELTREKIDWQMHIYGGTSHAFTNPVACDPSSGLNYNSKSDKRSWTEMNSLFEELFIL